MMVPVASPQKHVYPRKNKENGTDGTANSLQQSRFRSQCCNRMSVNFSQKHDWNLK